MNCSMAMSYLRMIKRPTQHLFIGDGRVIYEDNVVIEEKKWIPRKNLSIVILARLFLLKHLKKEIGKLP